jgi:CheY-like chemotaxis protein
MSPARLLLVDDDPELGLIVGVLARKAGQAVSCRSEVESAWAALAEGRPDLVLLDLELPGQSGLELLRRVRADAGLSGLPVALFCQSGLAARVAAGWGAGANYLLAKDVVTSPAAWATRTGEIIAHLRGQVPLTSLGWLGRSGSPVASWGDALNRALDLASPRPLGPEVLEQVLRRGLAHGFGRAPDDWLIGGAGRLAVPALPARAAGEQVERLLSSVVDQLWRLHGSQASGAFAERLRAELARLSP